MSRQGYDLSKINRLEEIDGEINVLAFELNKLIKIVESAKEDEEMNDMEIEKHNQMCLDIATIEQDIYDLEAEYTALEEETYEDAYGDYKYDQWKDNRNEED
jgi:hypothetical protein